MIITRAIGIDLGTTNSAVSMLELNERDLLLCMDAQSRTTIPSCVWQNHRTGSKPRLVCYTYSNVHLCLQDHRKWEHPVNRDRLFW